MTPTKKYFAAIISTLALLIQSSSINAASNSSNTLPTQKPNHAAPTHCTEYWQYGSDFLAEHCSLALSLLQETDVAAFTTTRIEFLAPGASPTETTALSLKTPRKYSYDTCIIALALIDTVWPEGDVPVGLLPRDDWRREVSTFASLELAAKQVLKECVALRHSFGLTIDGENEHALGVFVWGSGSWLDEEFSAAVDVRLVNGTGLGYKTGVGDDDARE
ncbi:MAG: hypothetical protein Q9191_005233 [Dirinaria sp. TL-2023a]